MSDKKNPVPRFTVVTLGARDMKRSIAFYEGLGFARKMRVTGEAVAFFDTGATVLALYPWDQLAADAALKDGGPSPGFHGMTLAWNCRSAEEVDEVLEFATAQGAQKQKPAAKTEYGGYSGYFSDPDGTSVGSRGRPGNRSRRRPSCSPDGVRRFEAPPNSSIAAA